MGSFEQIVTNLYFLFTLAHAHAPAPVHFVLHTAHLMFILNLAHLSFCSAHSQKLPNLVVAKSTLIKSFYNTDFFLKYPEFINL